MGWYTLLRMKRSGTSEMSACEWRAARADSHSFSMLFPMPRSQRDRMLAGEEYDSRDPELLALAHRARALLAEFAALPSTGTDGRRRALTDLLGSIGDGVWIEPPFFCDYGAHVTIGAETFVNVNC